MIRSKPRFTGIAGNVRGATLVEFALVTPVMILLILGLCDFCYRAYAQAVLTGAVQRAARNATLEGSASSLDSLDASVVEAVRRVARNATWASTRKSYREFGDVAPEPFDDDNKNGSRDAKECFSDINDNKVWDSDPGLSGQGGANDVTVYTMTINYPRLFPLTGLLGLASTQRLVATTILKNQPYGSQAVKSPDTICT